MKKIGIMTAIILINFIFQTSLYNFFNILGTIPNISLALVVIFALLTNNVVGGALGMLTGMLYDITLYNVFGVYTLIYFIIGALVGCLSEDANKENYIIYGGITFIATIFMDVALFLILFFMKYRVENVLLIAQNIILEIVINTVISVMIFKIIIYFFNMLNIKLISR